MDEWKDYYDEYSCYCTHILVLLLFEKQNVFGYYFYYFTVCFSKYYTKRRKKEKTIPRDSRIHIINVINSRFTVVLLIVTYENNAYCFTDRQNSYR